MINRRTFVLGTTLAATVPTLGISLLATPSGHGTAKRTRLHDRRLGGSQR